MPRIVAFVAILCFAAVATAFPVAAAPEARAVEGDCRTDTIVVLFWPRGHGAIPQIGFPAFRTPHVEVYKFDGGRTYRDANQLAYADGKGEIQVRPVCARRRDHVTVQQLPATSTTAARVFTCRTKGNTLVQVRKLAGAGVRSEVRLIEPPNRLVLRALVLPNAFGSNVSYNFARCTAGVLRG